ncbi:serine/threonine-protein kinase, partial [Bifidobacterium leontopitheci]
MSDALNLEPGALVGGYTLVSRLGSGAMGSVWRVRDDGGQEYAMKILRDSLSDDRPGDAQAERDQLTARERLRREAMALRKVNHPGVCGIVDMELDDSLAFIVTELIEGQNLREDVATNGPYVADDLERLASKLMDAVRAVHAAGIVHRDIKPTNVMVSATGPVLVDFGIAMGAGESHVTRTGLVMGTPGFIAPEIIEGTESDDITDWWSVASVLAFAATGKPVFGTKPMMAVLEREAAGNANLAGLPAGTMTAFRAALNPDRTRRCTPEQLLHAITVDAFDPLAWPQAQSGGALGVAGGTTAGHDSQDVMRPFDATGLSNPRLLWRPVTQADSFVPATAAGADGLARTEPIEAGLPATSVMPETARGGATVTMPLNETTPLSGSRNDTAATMSLTGGRADDATADGLFSDDVPNDDFSNDDVPTVADPTLRPALQRLIRQQPYAGAPVPGVGMPGVSGVPGFGAAAGATIPLGPPPVGSADSPRQQGQDFGHDTHGNIPADGTRRRERDDIAQTRPMQPMDGNATSATLPMPARNVPDTVQSTQVIDQTEPEPVHAPAIVPKRDTQSDRTAAIESGTQPMTAATRTISSTAAMPDVEDGTAQLGPPPHTPADSPRPRGREDLLPATRPMPSVEGPLDWRFASPPTPGQPLMSHAAAPPPPAPPPATPHTV